jgi:hypothetical protein
MVEIKLNYGQPCDMNMGNKIQISLLGNKKKYQKNYNDVNHLIWSPIDNANHFQ